MSSTFAILNLPRSNDSIENLNFNSKRSVHVIHLHSLFKLNWEDVSKCIENDTLDKRRFHSRSIFHFWIRWHCNARMKSQQKRHIRPYFRITSDAIDFYWVTIIYSNLVNGSFYREIEQNVPLCSDMESKRNWINV